MNVPLTTSLKKYWIYVYIYIYICIILNPWNNDITETHPPHPSKKGTYSNSPTKQLREAQKSWKKSGPTLRLTTTGDVVMWFQCQCHRWVWPRWWMNRCIQGSNLCRCRTAMDGKGDGWMDGWMDGWIGFRGFGVSGVWGLGFFEKKIEKSWQMIGIGTVFFLMILDYWVNTVLVNHIIVKIHA